MKHPMPNDKIDGTTVVASVVMNDDEPGQAWWTVLLLHPESPFFEVAEVYENGSPRLTLAREYNIIPAAEAYADNSGGY